MNLVNLYVMQAGRRDEDICIARVQGTPDLYHITYKPRDGKKCVYEFQLNRSSVMDYIYDMLELLSMDMYPYDSIQVETKMSPAVVLPIMDLDDDSTRSLVGRTVMAALDTPLAVAKRSSDE